MSIQDREFALFEAVQDAENLCERLEQIAGERSLLVVARSVLACLQVKQELAAEAAKRKSRATT